MFTVKHITYPSNGDEPATAVEELYEAQHVTKTQSGIRLAGAGYGGDIPSGAEILLPSSPGAVVFVMNETGATVSRFDL